MTDSSPDQITNTRYSAEMDTATGRLQCHLCCETYTQKSHLKRHLLNSHELRNNDPFFSSPKWSPLPSSIEVECEACKKRVNCEQLQRHKRQYCKANVNSIKSTDKTNSKFDKSENEIVSETKGIVYKKCMVPRAIFKDLSKEMDLKDLDMYLAEYSYIDGYLPTQADNAVFDTLREKSLDYECYPHLKRWLVHIKSFELELGKSFR